MGLNAAFAWASGGVASVDFAQIVIRVGDSVTYNLEFDNGQGVAIPVSGTIPSSPANSTGSLMFTPLANQSGTATITITVTD